MVVVFNNSGKISESMKNPYSAVGKELCGPHIIKVWNAVSRFIEEQLCLHNHGVIIPGFATITYKVIKSNVTAVQDLVERRPFILLSEKLVKMYNLKSPRPRYTLDLPDVNLNISSVALISGLNKRVVESAIEETISAFARAVASESDVEFHFPQIGRILINCRKVNQVFDSAFLKNHFLGKKFIQDKRCPTKSQLAQPK